MAPIISLSASFALALWFSTALASPTDAGEILSPAIANSTDSVAALDEYKLDCSSGNYPNVCENWCYYVFCHKKGMDNNSPFWEVTVNRNAANRGKSECGKYSPNKCSSTRAGEWPLNPVAKQDCDEQPKNTNDEGGADAATRCMDQSENRREGNKWKNFIASGGPNGAMIKDKTKIRVVLENASSTGLCASYVNRGSTFCPSPASPNDINVAMDAIRQQ